MCWHTILSWIICLFSCAFNLKHEIQLITVMDCQPTPEWIITGQQESQHMHLGNATDPKQSNTIRNLHICKHKTAGASLWMPNLQSGAQSLILCAQTPAQREQQPLNWVIPLSPLHQNTSQNTPGNLGFTLYLLSLSQREENTKQKAHLYSYLSPQHQLKSEDCKNAFTHLCCITHATTFPETPVVPAFHNQWPSNEPHGLKGGKRNSEYFLVSSKNCRVSLLF